MQFHHFDENYLRRLAAGDSKTQEHFIAYFSELIQLKLRPRLSSPQAIEDLRQEIFARVFAALNEGKVRQPERLGALVNSIGNNVLLEYYRSSARNAAVVDAQEDRDDFDLQESLATKQVEKQVRQMLDGLPERDQLLLRLIFLEEKSKDEICRDFAVDQDYLRVLLNRVRAGFRALYTDSKVRTREMLDSQKS
jgi:RNA polymerase sigma-70 factor (ECF subfamily)